MIELVKEELTICLDGIDACVLEKPMSWISVLYGREGAGVGPWVIKSGYL